MRVLFLAVCRRRIAVTRLPTWHLLCLPKAGPTTYSSHLHPRSYSALPQSAPSSLGETIETFSNTLYDPDTTPDTCWEAFLQICEDPEVVTSLHDYNHVKVFLAVLRETPSETAIERINSVLATFQRIGRPITQHEYIHLCKAYGDRMDLMVAFDILTRMELTSTPWSTSVMNSMLHNLSNRRDMADCWQLLAQMTGKGILADEITLNTFLRGYVKLRDMKSAGGLLGWGPEKKSPAFFAKLWAEGSLEPNMRTLSLFVEGYAAVGQMGAAGAAFDKLKQMGSPDVRTANDLICGYMRKGQLDEAKKVEAEMKDLGIDANAFTMNWLLRGLCRSGKMDEALKKYNDLVEKGISPTIETMTSLVNGFVEKGDMKMAVKVFDELEEHALKPTASVMTDLVKGFCRAGNLKTAWQMLGKMKKRGLLTTKALNLFIAGCVKNADMVQAHATFNAIEANGLAPNVHSYVALMRGYASIGDAQTCKDLIDKFKKTNLQPSMDLYNQLIEAHLKRTDLRAALEAMRESNLQPDVNTYNLLIMFCRDHQDLSGAIGFFECIEKDGLQPTDSSYGALLHAHAACRDIDGLYKRFREMKRKGITPTVYHHQAIIVAHINGGRMDDAVTAFEDMREAGVQEDGKVYNVIIKGFSRLGMQERATEWRERAKKNGFVIQ